MLVIAFACIFGVPAVAKAGFVPPPLKNQATANPDATLNVIVLGQPTATSSTLKEHVRNAGGRDLVPFSVIRGIVANLTGSQLLSLSADPTVRSITPNGRVKGQSLTSGLIWRVATGISTLTGSVLSPAPKAPGIAFVDSGIDAPRYGDFGKRIQGVLDFTGTSGPSGRDDNGHGTLVAGIAAGSSVAYPGASPTSNVWSLKVVRGDGTSYTGDVIAAADWIYKNAFSNNIRVANFSLRNSFPNFAAYDPLDAAVRALWLNGTVVVASAGNSGNGRMLYAPANEPFVITVGASDIADTVTRSDDSNAPWTSYGYTAEGFAKPELAAPGRWMVGPVPPGTSTLARTFADRVVAPGYMWMSGTSFSAPVVSGLAAQILARHPGFTPDQVKGALMLTAKRAPLAAPLSLGVGEVDASAASLTSPPNPNKNLYQFVRNDADGSASFDWDGWNAYVASTASWTDASWTDASWTDASWTDASWTDASWTDASWTDASWTDASWTDASWTDASWTDASWTDASWTDSTPRE